MEHITIIHNGVTENIYDTPENIAWIMQQIYIAVNSKKTSTIPVDAIETDHATLCKDALKTFMFLKKLKNKAVSEVLGCTENYVAQYRSGSKKISFERIVKLTLHFDMKTEFRNGKIIFI